MFNRILVATMSAILVLSIVVPVRAAEEAVDILDLASRLSAKPAGLEKALNEVANKTEKKKPDPAQAAKADEKTGYIIWYGDFGVYGGQTKDEAIQGGKDAKRRNPNTHIRVTVHKYTGNLSVKDVSETPGTQILDIP